MSDTGNTAVNEDSLAAQVMAVIARTQRIPLETLSLDKTFEELKIDSLDGINIIFAIENEFGIAIPDEGVQNLQSIRHVVDGVRKLVEEKKLNAASDAI
jgi:acyl carrier protein